MLIKKNGIYKPVINWILKLMSSISMIDMPYIWDGFTVVLLGHWRLFSAILSAHVSHNVSMWSKLKVTTKLEAACFSNFSYEFLEVIFHIAIEIIIYF